MVIRDIGDYELREKLGNGTFAIVYRAWDKALRVEVAVKVLNQEYAEDEVLSEKFRGEAQKTALLRGNENTIHVSRVAAFRDDNGLERPYFVMDLIQGWTLQRWIQDHGYPPLEIALLILLGLYRGLEHAHENGLLHCDLKPANIMFTSRGRVVVTDFGLARRLAGMSDKTKSVVIQGGTIPYMSPEQTRAEELDARSDICSAGIISHELLAGARLFDGTSQSAVMQRIQTETPMRLDELNPLVPPQLADLVRRMLEKDPVQRPGSMTEVRAGLEGVVDELGLLRVQQDLLREYVASPSEVAGRLKQQAIERYGPQAERLEAEGKLDQAYLANLRILRLESDHREARSGYERLKQQLTTHSGQPVPGKEKLLSYVPPPPPAPWRRLLQAIRSRLGPDMVIRMGIGAAALGLLVVGALLVRMMWPVPSPQKPREPEVEASVLRLDLEPADAAVYLDGRAVSARPGGGLDGLAPGTRMVRIVKPGFVTFEQLVDLRPGEVRRVTMRLRVEAPEAP